MNLLEQKQIGDYVLSRVYGPVLMAQKEMMQEYFENFDFFEVAKRWFKPRSYDVYEIPKVQIKFDG